MLIRQAPAAPPVDDAAVLIDFDGAQYLVELRWSDRPLDFRQLAPHLVTLYGCPDLRRLFISFEQGRDLKELLRGGRDRAEAFVRGG